MHLNVMFVDCGVLEKSVIIKSVLILNNKNLSSKLRSLII